MDRIDIQVEVPAVKYKELSDKATGEDSATIRTRVNRAREIQLQRFRQRKIFCNAQMSSRDIRTYCQPDAAGEKLLENALQRLGLSARPIPAFSKSPAPSPTSLARDTLPVPISRRPFSTGLWTGSELIEIGDLEKYKKKLNGMAGLSSLAHKGDPTCHVRFSTLYDELQSAGNDAVHQGAYARILTDRAVDITIILEDALIESKPGLGHHLWAPPCRRPTCFPGRLGLSRSPARQPSETKLRLGGRPEAPPYR